MLLGSDESGDENYGMGGYGTIQDAKERSQDRRKNLDAMKYDKKSSALSELKAKRQERERRDMERAKKEKEKSRGKIWFAIDAIGVQSSKTYFGS